MTNEFMPHGHCVYWTPWLINQWVVANSLIAISYAAIPVVIIGHVAEYWNKSDAYVRCMVIMFANFIIACGLTHAMKIAEIWWPLYRFGVFLDWWCAVSSVATFWMLMARRKT